MIDPAESTGFFVRVDLGQVIIVTVITVIGYLFKRVLDDMSQTQKLFEQRMYEMNMHVQRLVGRSEWNGMERREKS